jgi:hypothetical protein
LAVVVAEVLTILQAQMVGQQVVVQRTATGMLKALQLLLLHRKEIVGAERVQVVMAAVAVVAQMLLVQMAARISVVMAGLVA